MSILAEKRKRSTPNGRQWTTADLAALPDELPSGPALYEIWEGELRVMSPPGEIHGAVEATIAAALKQLGDWAVGGRSSCGEVAVVVQEDPLTVFGADAAFLAKEQLPARRSPEGYLLTVPAIIAEVRSEKESLASLERKAAQYLDAGARLVWVADPQRERVTVYRAGEKPQVLGAGDTLTAEGVIPGFQFPVARLFEGLD